MDPKRVKYLDYLRILSIFAVVLVHSQGQSWYTADVRSFEWNVLNFFDGLCRWSVPVLVMVSGTLFLGKEQPLKKLFFKSILRILLAFFFWSTLYALWDLHVTHAVDSIKGFLKAILTGHYHMWFLLMITGLYLFVPLLNKIAENKKLMRYFVILSFLFACLIPQCLNILGLRFSGAARVLKSFLSALNLHFVAGYSGYFVLGCLLSQTEIKGRLEKIIYIFGLLGLAATVAAASLLAIRQQEASALF